MRIRQFLLSLLTFAFAASAPCIAAEETDAANLSFPAAAGLGMPDNEELERRNARIGHVLIRIDNVFDTTRQLAAPYRIVDQLHIPTRDQTVASQLLFKSGDRYSGRTLAETARALRTRDYFKEAAVVPVRYNDDNTVDVEVRVRDAWTLNPGISFGRKGGTNSTRVRFEDSNFLGLGKSIALSRGSDVDRTTWQIAYRDPNVFGSRWNFSVVRAELSDGEESSVALGMPFYSFDSQWSLGVRGLESRSDVSRYALGEIVDRVQMTHEVADIHGGISKGWRDGWVTRFLTGMRYEARAFAAPAFGIAFADIPADRTLSYPWIGIEVTEDDYRSTRNLNQIGRIEDLYLGSSVRFDIGYATGLFGADRDALMLSGAAQSGWELAEDEFLTGRVDLAGRLESGALHNGLLRFESRYYRRQSPRRVLFAGLNAALSSRLDAEEQLLLGGDNGLRGYPLRYQGGTALALLTLEERVYTNWQPLKLFDVGAAAFIDAGRAWGQDPVAQAPSEWLGDIGVGLRLGSARSGRGNVLHIDLAYPLTGIDARHVQLLVETRTSF